MNLFSKIASILTGTNSIPTDKVLGVDVSHWNGYVNWTTMQQKGVEFAVTKATDFSVSTGKPFVDDKSIQNYNGMKNVGILTGAYCWLQPKIDPKTQAHFYLDSFYSKYPTDLPPVLDFEDKAVNSWSDMLWRAQVWLEIVEKETGRTPILYTSPGYMAYFNKTTSSFLGKYYLWVAHYIQRSYPTVPSQWGDWTLWQYSPLGQYPYYVYGGTGLGRTWGSSSAGLDMNWFRGKRSDLLAICENEATPEPPVPPTNPELFRAKCTANTLNVRTGAGITYPLSPPAVTFGQIVSVYEEKNGWYRIGDNKWCSADYLQRITDIQIFMPIVISQNPAPIPEPVNFDNVLFYPLDEGKFYLTQYFGENPSWYPTSKGHNGVDYGVPTGNKIYAARDGIVTVAREDTTGYGRHVRIEHKNGELTIYGHLSKMLVAVGETVKAKQVIGLSGGALSDPYRGNSTGAHLHFELRLKSGAPQVAGGYVYGAVDPMPLLASHSWDGVIKEPLFEAVCSVNALYTRFGAGINFYTNGHLTLNQVAGVYEEKNGWYKIYLQRQVWVSGEYMRIR